MEALCCDLGIIRLEFNPDEPALEPQAYLSDRARSEEWIEDDVIRFRTGENRGRDQAWRECGEVSIREWLSVDAPDRSPVPGARLRRGGFKNRPVIVEIVF